MMICVVDSPERAEYDDVDDNGDDLSDDDDDDDDDGDDVVLSPRHCRLCRSVSQGNAN